jgi:hypothetical protein
VPELVDAAGGHANLCVHHVANRVTAGGQRRQFPHALLQHFNCSQSKTLFASQHWSRTEFGQ